MKPPAGFDRSPRESHEASNEKVKLARELQKLVALRNPCSFCRHQGDQRLVRFASRLAEPYLAVPAFAAHALTDA